MSDESHEQGVVEDLEERVTDLEVAHESGEGHDDDPFDPMDDNEGTEGDDGSDDPAETK